MASSPSRGAPPSVMRVLVVDDSSPSRLALVSAMRRLPGIEITGAVGTIAEALAAIAKDLPDVVTVDKQLDHEDGLDLIDLIFARFPDVIPVLVTAMTAEQIGPSLERLDGRAVEFLGKPSRGSRFEDWVVGALASTLERVRRTVRVKDTSIFGKVFTPRPMRPTELVWPDLILVGSSTGGPAAVRSFLEHIPSDCTAPIVITQHMPPVFTKVFADQLDRRVDRSVFEAAEGDILRPGGVWISPGDRHLTLSREGKVWQTHLDDRPHLHGCRPAVDHLFTSVAEHFVGQITVVVLTGMGVDGRAGAQRLRDAGGRGVRILAQSKETCAVWGMPAAIVDANLADDTGSPEELSSQLRFENLFRRRR